jgi:hypothetical protein
MDTFGGENASLTLPKNEVDIFLWLILKSSSSSGFVPNKLGRKRPTEELTVDDLSRPSFIGLWQPGVGAPNQYLLRADSGFGVRKLLSDNAGDCKRSSEVVVQQLGARMRPDGGGMAKRSACSSFL